MRITLPQRLKPTQLRLICAVEDSGKLQLAAETVGISQPAASRMLSEIRADEGAPLLERLPRGMAVLPFIGLQIVGLMLVHVLPTNRPFPALTSELRRLFQ